MGAFISADESSAVNQLATQQLARRCDQETERFFQKEEYDPRFCFELFKRAAGQNDQQAWSRLYHCYQPLVIGWVKRHTTFPLSGETAPHFANLAFEKLWNSLDGGGIDRFDDLKSILKYLQLCVHSALIDHARAAELETVQLEVAEYEEHQTNLASPVEDSVAQRRQADQLWQYLEQSLKDEQERAVVHATFVLGWKPGQIHQEYKRYFNDVSDVYRVKQNVLSRLRRDPKIQGFLKS